MSQPRPICFVLMPFGTKKDPAGGPDIDFDAVYEEGIRPAIEAAGLEPVRADQERVGGIIHKPMLERLLLAEYAVADLSTANANVFYELGVRHAARPATTVSLFARGHKLPFDVSLMRCQPYDLGEGNRFGSDQASALVKALTSQLDHLRTEASRSSADSPLFQLIPDYRGPEVAHLKTDTFRSRLDYSRELQQRLAAARRAEDKELLRREAAALDGGNEETEVGVLVDLFLSFRALSMWDDMVAFYEGIHSDIVRNTVMMREQYALALNRIGERQRAIEVLDGVVADEGASSETCGILGRVYKDLWLDAETAGKRPLARGHLDRAIEAYLAGFEADWRDAYPGVNAVTLLEVRGDEASLEHQREILPIVHYAVKQRMKSEAPDYWDHATLLELAVLANDEAEAATHLARALAAVRERWEPETTATNVRIIRDARAGRGLDVDWLEEVLAALDEQASG